MQDEASLRKHQAAATSFIEYSVMHEFQQGFLADAFVPFWFFQKMR
jgi:hypothetical protein